MVSKSTKARLPQGTAEQKRQGDLAALYRAKVAQASLAILPSLALKAEEQDLPDKEKNAVAASIAYAKEWVSQVYGLTAEAPAAPEDDKTDGE